MPVNEQRRMILLAKVSEDSQIFLPVQVPGCCSLRIISSLHTINNKRGKKKRKCYKQDIISDALQ